MKSVILNNGNSIVINNSLTSGLTSIELTGYKAVKTWINQNKHKHNHDDILDSYKNMDIVMFKNGYGIVITFEYNDIKVLFSKNFKTVINMWIKLTDIL